MVNSLNCKNQTNPSYSGVTINISNPTVNPTGVNPTGVNHSCGSNCNCSCHSSQLANDFAVVDSLGNNQNVNSNYGVSVQESMVNNSQLNGVSNSQNQAEKFQQSYPPQYYLNNYNYLQGNSMNTPNSVSNRESLNGFNNVDPNIYSESNELDLSTSQNIINGVDERIAKQKELEANGQQKNVVALTNEYIMSLENYLNDQNSEIRIMAGKEVLTRLDEDRDRRDDAALNALLNKMLQDPDKLVRILALSAFSSKLASGNDYTVQLLQDIQNNPNSTKEDVLEVANILLGMSASTETVYEPVAQAQSA